MASLAFLDRACYAARMRLGIVVAATGEQAKVAMLGADGCDSCASKGSCALSAREQAPGERLTVRNVRGACAGDTVEIDLPRGVEAKVNLVVWGLPLVGLVGGAVAGARLLGHTGLGQDGAVLLGAAVGFALSFFGLRLFDSKAARDSDLGAEIVRVVRS